VYYQSRTIHIVGSKAKFLRVNIYMTVKPTLRRHSSYPNGSRFSFFFTYDIGSYTRVPFFTRIDKNRTRMWRARHITKNHFLPIHIYIYFLFLLLHIILTRNTYLKPSVGSNMLTLYEYLPIEIVLFSRI